MLATRYFMASTGIGAVGAAMLLAAQYSSPAVEVQQSASPDVQLAALPFEFNLSEVLPWAVGPSTGAVTVNALSDLTDPAAVAASAALQTVNQYGPLAFGLNSLRGVGIQQTVPGTNNTLATVTSTDQWAAGLAGLVSSTGAIGFTEAAAQYDPFMANHAGYLQTANQLGPLVFDLNVLKAIGFFQAPTGTLLASGYPDNVSAVDIGRWRAGIPGVIMNTGTTGFVDYADMGPGPVAANATGGLHTTTQIGSTTFDFNVLPSIGGGIMPYGVTFTMAPDLTAAETPFGPITPPPPGTIAPPPVVTGGPFITPPAPVVAPVAPVSAPLTAEPEEAPLPAVRATPDEPEVIPGVNGAPLAKTPKPTSPASPGGSPFAPLKPFSDMVQGGISAITGAKPATGAPGGDTGGEGGDGGGE